jgi:hypothetical protein
MKTGQVLRPKQPRNLALTLLGAALMGLAFLAGSLAAPWSPSRGAGLAFGFLALGIFLAEMAYPARRPRARPLGTAMRWLQAHIYLGLLGLLAVLFHSGLRWPHGTQGWALLVLSAWTTFSGLLGVWLQKWVPLALAEGLRVEALYERIPALAAGLRVEADALMAGAGDVLERFYRVEVRPDLDPVSPSWAYLLDVRSGRERALEPFRRLARFVDAADRERIDDLTDIYTEKLELDAQSALQRVLRSWPWLHVPAAGALLGLLAVHVLAWVWY